MYRRALEIDRKALGASNPGTAIDCLNLGRHLCLTGEPVEGSEFVTSGRLDPTRPSGAQEVQDGRRHPPK